MARTGPAAAYTDITPVREHLKRLLRAGLSRAAIARLSGMSVTTIREYERDSDAPSGAPPRDLVHRLNARRILGLSAAEAKGCRRFVDATPTVRRVQALVVAGYSRRMIADDLCLDHLRGAIARATILASTESAVADYYERHAFRSPVYRSATQRGHALEAQAEARAIGWLGPLDWEDIGTGELFWDDDVVAAPVSTPDPQQIATRIPIADIRPHLRALLGKGWTRVGIAAAAGVHSETVRAALGEKLVRGQETRSVRRGIAERLLAVPLASAATSEAIAA